MTGRAGPVDFTSTLACHPSQPRLAATAATAITDRSHLRPAASDGQSLTYGRKSSRSSFSPSLVLANRYHCDFRSRITFFVVIRPPMVFLLPSRIYQTRVYRNFEFRDRALDVYRSSSLKFLEVGSLSCEGVVFR